MAGPRGRVGVRRGRAGGGPRLTARAPPALRLAVLAYMQLLEDYSEPQPSVFYQTPQNEHIYQQKNKLLMEVYGFNDSFSAEAPQELAPPPALPPKQRQLVSRALLPGPGRRACRACRAGCHVALSLPPGRLPGLLLGLPAPGVVAPSLPLPPLQLGLACAQNVCFLCRRSRVFSSLLWLHYRPPRKEGLHQSTGHGLCTAICELDLHNGLATQGDLHPTLARDGPVETSPIEARWP